MDFHGISVEAIYKEIFAFHSTLSMVKNIRANKRNSLC